MHVPGIPENSLPAFAAALEMGAGVECDLRLSADGHAVVFHDSDANRLCGSPLKIGESALHDLLQLRMGEHPIPTLKQLLSLVAGRVPLLLEIKVERDLSRWLPALAHGLAAHAGPVGIMSFDPRISRLLKTKMPDVRRGLVVGGELPAWRRSIALHLADPQFIAVKRTALGQPWLAELRKRLPVYSWTIRTAEERAQARVQADALIWEADGRPRI